MKLQGQFYTTINDAKDNKPTYLSVIPAYNANPKKIYAMFSYEKFFIVCENNIGENFISSIDIEVLNKRLNFTKCKDLDIVLNDVCGVKKATMSCKLSDITNISPSINSDAAIILLVTFTTGDVVECKNIENLG